MDEALLKWLGIAVLGLMLLGYAVSDADARGHKRARERAYSPPYSALVATEDGKVLKNVAADELRHPASLTKVMTLYLLFEALDRGDIKLSDELTMSAHAAAAAPSKLWLKPGDKITVDTAIKAIVTRSANDVATAVAERIGGDEKYFAYLMTVKASDLGMPNTRYKNASGLPDSEQWTTAREQLILLTSLKQQFPKYYESFSVRSFVFRGRIIETHNRLLASGISGKTGYVRASGFNFVGAAKGLYVAVFGGRSGRDRDERVRSLINATDK